MSCVRQVNDCHPCNSGVTAPSKKRSGAGLFATILLAVLPKCPFCMLAFSSTLALCGKGEDSTVMAVQRHAGTIYLSLFLCGLTLLGLILNYQRRRTLIALIPVLTGMAFILISVTRAGGQMLYYTGIVLMLTGILLNMRKFSFLKS
jgi:hypothetical protein